MTEKSANLNRNGKNSLPPSSIMLAGKKAQNPPLPGNIGTATSPGHIAASAVELHCSTRIANLIPVPVGLLSGSRWTGQHSGQERSQLFRASDRGSVRRLRCPFGPCIRGRTRAYRIALLHQFCVPQARPV